MGQLWERRKKQEQSQWLCSQRQHSFKITQRKATNKSALLPAGTHVQQQNQSLLVVSLRYTLRNKDVNQNNKGVFSLSP